MPFDLLLPSSYKLSTKIAAALGAVLLLGAGAIGLTLYLSWQLEGSAAAVNDTGSLRLHGYQLSVLAAQASSGDPIAAEVREQIATIDATLAGLRSGDPQRPLYLPDTPAIREDFANIAAEWQTGLRPAANALLLMEGDPRKHALRGFKNQVAAFGGRVGALVRAIERDSDTRMAWLRASQVALLALALLLLGGLAYLIFRLIIGPINRLHDGMHRMKERDFEVRLAVDRGDEFGQLAQGFNRMADRLQGVYDNLEALVASKTAALALQNHELALLYDASAFLQHPLGMEALCQGLLERICGYFHADGGSVRMLDAKGNPHPVVRYGNSPELVAPAHRIFSRESVFPIYAQQQSLGYLNLYFAGEKTFNVRERSLLETLGQLLGTAVENQRLAASERLLAVAEERTLVAQGLHDSIAQGLNFLNLQVQMLDQSVKDGHLEEVAGIVPRLREGVQDSYEDVRELLHNFRTRLVEGDLVAAIEAALDKFRRQTGVEAELVALVGGPPFPREHQLQLLFIVQEALSNIRKHAHASRVTVRFEDRHDVTLSIEDDGAGFDPARLGSVTDSHVGIHIMRERAQRIHAELAVVSAPGAGTTVTLTLPQSLRRAA